MEQGETEASRSTDENTSPVTAPQDFCVSLRGFDTEQHAREFGDLIGLYVRELSRAFDLSGLDGVTIASDYAQALLDFDRGYETTHKLTPSQGIVFGIAMTPSAIRDGKLKSHMFFDASVLLPLEDEKHEEFRRSLHTLAHECAHVEVTQRFDTAFPGRLLRLKAANIREHVRWEVLVSCWDEYAVTRLCADIGEDPTSGYEETLVRALRDTKNTANDFIKAYRVHANVNQVVAEVWGAYAELLKFASYFAGNMIGRGLKLDDLPNAKSALDSHWFAPHFSRLQTICEDIWSEYGRWKDFSSFERLADLAEDVVRAGGLSFRELDDGSFYVDVPFTPDTMPDRPFYYGPPTFL